MTFTPVIIREVNDEIINWFHEQDLNVSRAITLEDQNLETDPKKGPFPMAQDQSQTAGSQTVGEAFLNDSRNSAAQSRLPSSRTSSLRNVARPKNVFATQRLSIPNWLRLTTTLATTDNVNFGIKLAKMPDKIGDLVKQTKLLSQYLTDIQVFPNQVQAETIAEDLFSQKLHGYTCLERGCLTTTVTQRDHLNTCQTMAKILNKSVVFSFKSKDSSGGEFFTYLIYIGRSSNEFRGGLHYVFETNVNVQLKLTGIDSSAIPEVSETLFDYTFNPTEIKKDMETFFSVERLPIQLVGQIVKVTENMQLSAGTWQIYQVGIRKKEEEASKDSLTGKQAISESTQGPDLEESARETFFKDTEKGTSTSGIEFTIPSSSLSDSIIFSQPSIPPLSVSTNNPTFDSNISGPVPFFYGNFVDESFVLTKKNSTHFLSGDEGFLIPTGSSTLFASSTVSFLGTDQGFVLRSTSLAGKVFLLSSLSFVFEHFSECYKKKVLLILHLFSSLLLLAFFVWNLP